LKELTSFGDHETVGVKQTMKDRKHC